MADDEDLQIVQVHVEHLRPADPQCLQHAVRRCGAVARGQREHVRRHVRVKPDALRRAPAAFRVRLAEVLALAVGGERRHALAADRADGVAQLAAPAALLPGVPVCRPARRRDSRCAPLPQSLDSAGRTHVDEAQADAPTKLHALRSPAKRAPAAVLAKLGPVDGDAQLEAQVLFVGDVRRVDQVRIADRHRPEQRSAQGRGLARPGLPDGLPLHRDLVVRHVCPIAAGPGAGAGGAVQVATKAPGHEPVAVGVDEVAGHVLAESRRGRARQPEVHGAGAPERDLRPAHYRPDLEPVAGQESFRGQDAEGIDVVVAFGLSAGPPVRSLEPLHEPVAAAKQRLVIRFERAVTLAQGVETGNLPHRPLQAAPQARDDVFQIVGERVDVGAQRSRGHNPGILGRPALTEHRLHADGQVCGMALHQIAQRAEVERRAADFAVLEQVRLHPPRQAAVQHVRDRGPFPLRSGGVPPVAVQRPDDRRVHVLGDHHVVAQIEGGRVDAAVEQLQRLGEVGPVVRDGPAVGQVHRHAMAPTGATGALPIVGGQRRHVAHQHRVEPADVDAELQGRRAHQTVHRLRVALEQVLQALALVRRHHRGMLFGAQHRVGAVEQLQVVAVLVFRDPFDDAVAAPGDAAAVRGLAGGGAATAPAPPLGVASSSFSPKTNSLRDSAACSTSGHSPAPSSSPASVR